MIGKVASRSSTQRERPEGGLHLSWQAHSTYNSLGSLSVLSIVASQRPVGSEGMDRLPSGNGYGTRSEVPSPTNKDETYSAESSLHSKVRGKVWATTTG